jgi:hypothetical protein
MSTKRSWDGALMTDDDRECERCGDIIKQGLFVSFRNIGSWHVDIRCPRCACIYLMNLGHGTPASQADETQTRWVCKACVYWAERRAALDRLETTKETQWLK